jgi:hypothetical protein
VSPLRGLWQATIWLLAMLLVVGLAHWPRYRPLPEGHGELKLSMAHLTERLQPCRTLSAEERAKLPPNMRALQTCERERAPAVVELLLNGHTLVQRAVPPAGLHNDGRSYLHQQWPLPAGSHQLTLRLRDTPRSEGYDHEQHFDLSLQPGASALLRVGDGQANLDPGGRPPAPH